MRFHLTDTIAKGAGAITIYTDQAGQNPSLTPDAVGADSVRAEQLRVHRDDRGAQYVDWPFDTDPATVLGS